METIKPYASVTPQRSAQDLRNEALQMIQKMRQPTAAISFADNSSIINAAQKPQEFSSTLSNLINSVNAKQQSAVSAQQEYETGEGKVSLTDAVLTTQQASMQFQLLASVRNKAISAYKEIMSMPV